MENKPKKKFYNEINLLRGMAALVIVLVHSTPTDSFPMPSKLLLLAHCLMGMFFMVSGFLNSGKFCGDSGHGKTAWGQFRNLLVPYLIYSLVAYVLKLATNNLGGSTISGILVGDTPCVILWFLWVLFVAGEITVLVGFVMTKLGVKNKAPVFLCLGIAVYISNYFIDYGVFDRVANCIVYMYTGIFVRGCYDSITKVLKNKYFTVAISLLFAVMFVLQSEYSPLLGFVCTAFLWRVALAIANHPGSIVYRLLDAIGLYCFEIYLWSYFVHVAVRMLFADIMQLGDVLVFVLMFVSGVAVPYIMARICKKYNIVLR